VAAGTGSELLVHEVGAARLVAAFQVFDGVRVHGIELRGGSPDCSTHSLAVFGERRVKLFALGLRVSADGSEVGELRLELEQRLPGFDHWVLDARFLEVPRLVLALTVELFDFTSLVVAVPGAGRWAACDWSE
jgi:WD repeat-containing protein 6